MIEKSFFFFVLMMFSLSSQVKQRIWTLADTLYLCSSPSSSQGDVFAQNFTAVLGRVWPFQITPGYADILGTRREVKMNIFGYLFESTDIAADVANFPKLFQIFNQIFEVLHGTNTKKRELWF